MGWRGALYAWESADTGEETTPEQVIGPDRQVIHVLCGKQEQHISADVAYAVWQYWQATGDEGFLLDAGAEILLETGRFWASRASWRRMATAISVASSDRTSITRHIDDNAYTNVMARWNIRRALEVAARCASAGPIAGQASRPPRPGRRRATAVAEAAETMATGLDAGNAGCSSSSRAFSLSKRSI